MISASLAILETDEQRNELAGFYNKSRKRLYAIAYSKLHDSASAEDAVQETFLRIADKPENFFGVPLEKRQSYADVIVRNISYDMLREKINKPIENLDDYESETATEISLEDIVIDNENAQALIVFIRSMPDGIKDALFLKTVHKASGAEIARLLDISEEAARKRLSRARSMIKEFLERRSHE
ncbi:MAG: RNA polymerase sigma factor [Oscillospiraceae bacterium]|nr:RNA polymerase sigma factor [Oscillospiraceae bacterium]